MSLNTDWIREIAISRAAGESPVIIITTDDVIRIQQLYKNIFDETPFNKSKILKYNAWEGLGEIIRDENGNLKMRKMELEKDDIYGQQQKMTLSQMLGKIDEMLKTTTTTLIIELLPIEHERRMLNLQTITLNTALMAWARSPEIMRRLSTIIIITDKPEEYLSECVMKASIHITPPLPDEKEREVIINKLIMTALKREARKNSKIAKALAKIRDPMELVRLTAGLNVSEISDIITSGIYKMAAGLISDMREYITKKKEETVLKLSGGVLTLEYTEYGFESVGGLHRLKEYIRDNIINILKHYEIAMKLGIELPRGILLLGPPGTGKTIFAQALAKEVGLLFIRMHPSLVFSKYVGESEHRIRRIIKLIESLAPCIVFLDEIDQLGHRSDVSTDSGVSRRVFSALLEWLGDKKRKAIVIGTTNEPDFLDRAFLRVGRFDLIVPVLYPDLEARKEILHVHTKVIRNIPLAEDVDFDFLARATEYWNGAEIENMVKIAARIAHRKIVNGERDTIVVTMDDFVEALERTKINIEERKEQYRRYLRIAERYTNDKKFLETIKEEISYEISELV